MTRADITVVEKHIERGALLSAFFLGAAIAALISGIALAAFLISVTEGCNNESAPPPAATHPGHVP